MVIVFRDKIMKQDHRTTFGRHIAAVPNGQATPTTSVMTDKWQVLNALTDAAADFGLNHRTLSVLRALISFHPDLMIAPAPHSTIVFPANKTLSQRLNGMPESTLRRHLATLVNAGIVSRHDSANRKRYARGGRCEGRIAFGFDLSPLARQQTRIFKLAEVAKSRRAALQSLRVDVAALRQSVLEITGDSELTDSAARLLRRVPDCTELTTVKRGLTETLQTFQTKKVSGTDAQNERHKQIDSIIYPEEETHPTTTQCHDQKPELEEVTEICSEYLSFFPDGASDWQGLSHIAYALVPMLGIERQVYAQAVKVMGAEHAITVILCLLESLSSIRNPGGYLRHLTKDATQGRLDVRLMLKTIAHKAKAAPIVS